MQSDERLVAGMRAADPASFEQAVRVHSGRMLAVAQRILRNEEDARDCVQDAFLRAFRALDTFESRASLGTWLHRIVVNVALTRIRSRSRRPEESIEDMLPRFDELGSRIDSGPDPSPPVDDLLERQEARVLVRNAIDALPESFRSVLIARDIEGYDTGETASLLGMGNSAVKTRLHRARAALKTLIERRQNESEKESHLDETK